MSFNSKTLARELFTFQLVPDTRLYYFQRKQMLQSTFNFFSYRIKSSLIGMSTDCSVHKMISRETVYNISVIVCKKNAYRASHNGFKRNHIFLSTIRRAQIRSQPIIKVDFLKELLVIRIMHLKKKKTFIIETDNNQYSGISNILHKKKT